MQVIKYYEELTSVSIGREHREELEFPDVTFCIQSGWKEEALSKMGLSNDFMKVQVDHFINQEIGDIDQIWDNSTHNWKKFPIYWTTDEGNFMYHDIQRKMLTILC